jgi:enoyl-CoA hydratase
MKFETISYEVNGPVIRIGLNRPKSINAINGIMKKELLKAFQQAALEIDSRAAVLFSHGAHFSSGIDLKDMAVDGWPHTPEGWGGHFDECIAVSRAMWDLEIPVVAAVKGYALGAGLDLAVTADFVLAADNAKFGAPEIMMGAFAPTLILPWLINMKKAREILAIGVELDARTAMELGLVNKVFPLEQLDKEVERWLTHICNIPKHASRMAKRVINRQYEIMGFWDSIAFNREMSVTLNLHKSKEEREEALRFIREEGVKALLKKQESITVVK